MKWKGHRLGVRSLAQATSSVDQASFSKHLLSTPGGHKPSKVQSTQNINKIGSALTELPVLWREQKLRSEYSMAGARISSEFYGDPEQRETSPAWKG